MDERGSDWPHARTGGGVGKAPHRRAIPESFNVGVIAPRDAVFHWLVSKDRVMSIAKIAVIDAEMISYAAVGDLDLGSKMSGIPTGWRNTELLGKADRTVLGRGCNVRKNCIREHDEERDRNIPRYLEFRRVSDFICRCHVVEHVGPQLEIAPKGRQRRSITVTDIARQPGLASTAWNCKRAYRHEEEDEHNRSS